MSAILFRSHVLGMGINNGRNVSHRMARYQDGVSVIFYIIMVSVIQNTCNRQHISPQEGDIILCYWLPATTTPVSGSLRGMGHHNWYKGLQWINNIHSLTCMARAIFRYEIWDVCHGYFFIIIMWDFCKILATDVPYLNLQGQGWGCLWPVQGLIIFYMGSCYAEYNIVFSYMLLGEYQDLFSVSCLE